MLALLTLVVGQVAVSDAALKAELDALEFKHFAGVVYMEKDGKELFYHAVGLADRESGRKFTRQTGFDIGSIVKPMVRTALYKLAESQALGLEDPITKYFKDVPEDKARITLAMLAQHKAGFQDVFGGDYQPMERDELMRKMLESKLLFEPGSKDEYSNSGYSMLATVIEKVTGEGIEQHLARTQFLPLGLKRLGYVLPGWSSVDTAIGYTRKGERWGSPRDKFWYADGPSWNLRGNGGMISTVGELAKWCNALHSGKLLGKDSYALMFPTWAAAAPSPTAISASAGGNGIFNTVMIYNPHRRVTIIAASTDGRFEVEVGLRPMLPKFMALADQAQ